MSYQPALVVEARDWRMANRLMHIAAQFTKRTVDGTYVEALFKYMTLADIRNGIDVQEHAIALPRLSTLIEAQRFVEAYVERFTENVGVDGQAMSYPQGVAARFPEPPRRRNVLENQFQWLQ